MKYKIRKIDGDRIAEMTLLEREADEEGYKFVGRAIREFENGDNSFSQRGEILYGVYSKSRCLGVCGLNIDPYTTKTGIGRVRHLYVSSKYRRMGIAKVLIDIIIVRAEKYFDILRLKSTKDAIGFYDKLGFEQKNEEHESHRLIFEKRVITR